MIKVGILSMQRMFNYGSFLQAYGLKCMLEELGAEVQFVDYHPGKTLIPEDGGHGLARKVSKVVEVLKYHAPFKEKLRFIKYKKNYAINYYPYLGIGNEKNYAPKLDLLVIGSDEVFNCVQNNTNVGFAPELFGVNHNAKRLISYAASCGNTTLEKLEKYDVKEQVAEWLEAFNSISVRDDNTKEVVQNLTNTIVQNHLDPVLAYDFIGKCKDIPKCTEKLKYIILYGYSGRFNKEECKKIREYADKQACKVFCIGGVQDCCDKFIDCSPFEVLAYFKNAQAVVTDTFHGTIMSIITHQKFVTRVRSNGYGNVEKLTDLLTRLDLNSRILKSMDDLEELLEIPISYEKTDKIIENERKRTYGYLEEQLRLTESSRRNK